MLLRCSCGCQFTHASARSTAVCPSCGREQTEAGAPVRRLSTLHLTYLVAGAAGVLVALLVVLLMLRRRDDPLRDELRSASRPSPRRAVPPPPADPAPPPAPPATETLVFAPAPPPRPEGPVLEPRVDLTQTLGRINRLAERSNLAGLLENVLRLRGAHEAAGDFAARLKAFDAEIRALSAPHASRIEIASLPPRMQPGDALEAFGTTSLEPRPQALADAVLDWFRIFQPGAFVLATVRRGNDVFTVALFFTERDAELNDALAHAGVIPGAGGVDEDLVARALPSDLMEDVRRRMAQLHPGLRVRIPPDEIARAEALLAARRATPADERFLRVRLLQELVAPLEEEIAVHGRRAEELERLGPDTVFPDVLYFKDGRRLACRILGEDDKGVDIRVPIGRARMSKDNLRSFERGDAPFDDFHERYEKARTDPDGLVALLDWCAGKKLPQQRELAASRLLVLDPAHPRARAELGLPPLDAAAPLPAGESAADVVRLRDGSVRAGLIVAETETSLTLEIPARGPRGEVVGALRQTIARIHVAAVDRLSDDARRRALAERASRLDREDKAEDAAARLPVGPSAFGGLPGLKAQGGRFDLFSTAPERETKETARELDALFAGFEAVFPVRRNADRRLQAYFFSDPRTYEAFQRATRGTLSAGTAYYCPRANHLAACSDMGDEEAADLRRRMEASSMEIERLRKAAPAEEKRVEDHIRALHKEFADQMERARKATAEIPPAFRAQRQKAIADARAAREKEIRAEEKSLRDRAAAFRREAEASIRHHQAQIRAHAALLRSPSRDREQLLFHQAFHAFAATYLWETRAPLRGLEEGMACYFESAVAGPDGLRPGPPPQALLKILREHRRGAPALPLEQVLRGGAEDPHGAAPTAELAHAWALAHFLRSRSTDRARMDAFVSEASGGLDLGEALERMMGRPRARLQAEFEAHVDGLTGMKR